MTIATRLAALCLALLCAGALADARDLIAFLRALPPVSGRPPPNDLSFPFSIRRAIGIWKALFFIAAPLTPDPKQSAAWNRGHYLSEALAHCAECHSPRNLLGAIVGSQAFAGGPDPLGEGWIPNITQAADGIRDWSKADVASLLTNGVTPDGDKVEEPMSEVVDDLAQLPKSDVEAIADFVKSLPPRLGPPKPKKN